MENWTEIKIAVNAKDIDKASDIANVVVPYGIYIEDYTNLEQEVEDIAHIDLIDEDLLKKDRNQAFVHIYLEPDVSPSEAVAFLSERYNAEGIEHTIELLDCAEEDWRNNWKKYFNPIEVGEKLLIRPSWRDDYDANGRIILNIDPGLAFGTGGHETTRLCLEMCEKYMKKGDRVLDVGCGSGILSVASVLLGAEKGVGVDIDPVAVKVACENAEMNGVGDRTSYEVGDLAEKVSGRFDIVIANIVADIIMRLVPDVENYMKDDAVFICSGIIDIRKDEVVSCLENNGFTVTQTVNEDNWYAIAAKRG